MTNSIPQSMKEFSRRRFLSQSAAIAASLRIGGWPARLAAEQRTPDGLPPLRSCVFLFYYGGPSHLDTYDPKPNSPDSVRGEFGTIDTAVPGLQVSEHLPHMSRVMDRVCLVRSMHHTNRLHDSASTETFTGRQSPQGDREEFLPIPQFFPCHGSVISALLKPHPNDVTHALLPTLIHNVIDVPCQGGGFLGQRFDPFLVAADAASGKYRADVLSRPEQLSPTRISNRRELLSRLELQTDFLQRPGARQLARHWERAYDLLQSTRLPKALSIQEETDEQKSRYGWGMERTGSGRAASAAERPLRGLNLLMARRLVEAGVPFINVNDFRQQGTNWDSHANNFAEHRDVLLPAADRGLSAFLLDLEDRGLLETTLIVALGEFGRTPTINANAGRDHWPDCYSAVLAGGGARRGHVHGASDRIGAYPESAPVTPADLAATIYWRFGLDHRAEIHDPNGRPYRLSDGRPLRELFEQHV